MNDKQRNSFKILVTLSAILLFYIGFKEPSYRPILIFILIGLFFFSRQIWNKK